MRVSRKLFMKLTLNNFYVLFLQMLFAFYLIFGYVINNYYLLSGFFFCTALLYLILKKDSKINISNSLFLVLFLLIYQFASSLWALNQSFAMKYALVMIVNFLIIIILDITKVLNDRILYFLFTFSSIHVVCTIVQYFRPSIISGFALKLLNPSKYAINQQLFIYNKAYAGITGQTGNNAFYITIFLFSLIWMIGKKQKLWLNILLIPGFIALFLTQKRSYIIFTVIYWFLDFFIISKKSKNSKRSYLYFSGYIILLVILIWGLYKISLTYFDFSQLLEKFNKGNIDNVSAYSSERVSLWLKSLELSTKKIITGYGYLSSDILLGMFAHNNYLQILLEMGIFAFFTYIIIMFGNFIKCIKYKLMGFEFSVICLLIWLSLMSTWYFEIDQCILFFYVVIIISRDKRIGVEN